MAAATLVTLIGSIYDATTGAKRTSGRLYLRPKSFIRNGPNLVAPKTISYDIPGTGDISLPIAPTAGDSVAYVVEYDPNPADTSLPFRLKSGYFRNEWTVPVNYPWTVQNTSGLVGYWRLEETSGTTAFDSGPNGLNGTYAGTPTLAAAGALADGSKAIPFDGIDDVLTVTNTAALNFGTGDFSVEFWCKFNPANGTDNPRWLLGKGQPYSSVTAGWSISGVTTADPVSIVMYVSDGVITGTNPPGCVQNEGAPLVAARGSWHHVVFTVDRTNRFLRGYLNGAQVGTGVAIPAGFGSVTNTANQLIGKGNVSNFYTGSLDEVALYNRLLTATDITSHYSFRTFSTVDISIL